MICLRSLARQSAKQIPIATVGISSHNTEVVAGADALVGNSSRDNNHSKKIFYVCLKDEVPISTIRTDHCERGVEISYIVDEEYRGRGPLAECPRFIQRGHRKT
jgi:hypothetical protein